MGTKVKSAKIVVVLRMWILSFRLFDINWQELTAYCNKDIIEMTYECSLETLEIKSDKLIKCFGN